MTAGESFVKAIKPIGCVLFLGLFAVFMVFCFTAKAPLDGYVCPETTEYYSEHLDEFEAELEQHLLPRVDGVVDCSVEGDKILIIIKSGDYEESSSVITHYYGTEIFDIRKSD